MFRLVLEASTQAQGTWQLWAKQFSVIHYFQAPSLDDG